MPFNPSTNRLDALWNFVDQFQAGDDAARSDFDTAFQDVRAGINDMAAYLEGLLNVDGLTDQRYLGRSATPPTLRANGDNLFIGDFYSTSDAAGRTNLFYVWDGVAFVPASDFAAITPFFKSLAVVDTAATMRGLLQLGTAALQNADAFAPVSVGGAIAFFLSLAENGLAKPLVDWNNAHLTGPGCGFFEGDAAAVNGPAVLNTVGVYLAYDANSGLMIASTPSTGAVYVRSRSAGVWPVAWTTLPIFDTTTGIIVQTATAAFAKRTITSPDGSITITNPGGVAGNISLTVNEANLVIPRAALADATINRAKLDTGLASQAYSFTSGGGSSDVALNPYCFMPALNHGTNVATLTFIGGATSADTPRVRVSAPGSAAGTVFWRYVNA